MPDPTEPITAPDTAAPGLVVDRARARVLRDGSRDWLSWSLTAPQLGDLELLLNGFFAPLDGFMTRADHEAVQKTMRLSSGQLWPLPVGLAVPGGLAGQLTPGARLALRDPEGVMLAVLHVAEIWRANEEQGLLETGSTVVSPAEAGVFFVGGRVEGLLPPVHYDFTTLRLTAPGVRRQIARRGWRRTIAFAPSTLLHRAEVEAALHLMSELDAGLVVHVADGARGDVHHYARMRCYRLALDRFPPERVLLVLSPPIRNQEAARSALALALVQKQFGCTHVLLSPSDDPDDRDRTLTAHAAEIGVEPIPFPRLAYSPDIDSYNAASDSAPPPPLSEAGLQQLLEEGGAIPAWFTYPEIEDQLRRSYPPRCERGLTIFFTGLSGSGKSTLANALLDLLLERGGRAISLLDGDLARRHLSSELGFSKAHRTLNVRRIGYVASEITRSGGVAICALIAPHAAIREEVRRMIEAVGGFVLVHVATTLEVCESRDRKGLYAKARAGLLTEFTGISDPYDVPEDAELTINAGTQSVSAAAQAVLQYLELAGYLTPQPGARD